MLSQRTLKIPSETDKICLHKVLNPLPCNVTKRSDTFKNPAGFAARFLKCIRPFHNTAEQMVKYSKSD